MNKVWQTECGFLFTTLFSGLALSVPAQKPADEVMNAEKSFAAYSVEHGTKAAFLKFLDSNSVVFEAGKAVNGMTAWKQKNNAPGVLNWRPLYGTVSSSGDLGFTTGPWTFQPKTAQDSVVARGQYSTVWKKNKQGEWKALVDLGNTGVPALDSTVSTVGEESRKFIGGTWNNLLNREQKFIAQTKAADSAARRKRYEEAVGNVCLLNRNGQRPAKYRGDVSRATATMPAQIEYTVQGSGLSSAGDLGYVYGSTVMNNKPENYLRLWRREGKEWRLVLEVLRY